MFSIRVVVTVLVVARLPNEYRARALVMVEPLHPHPDLVVPVISKTLDERVKSVRAQVYARQLMASAIEELNLYPQEREKNGLDGAGIVSWAEIPLFEDATATAAYTENAKQQLRELIRQNYNHPAIFFSTPVSVASNISSRACE